ncbi:LysM peptidoglycan-binding domain-containing protein [Chlamydia buteonis]|uniref:LysM peptidoglycan-binding domain-containing protein n=1 Tax=Chlamydia buteonis TaxID=2494525 RepID=A0ABX8LAC5_9CHLA|nr:LysM peptidoglycan-binding domain-containing protein [Chlamydia buteonis]QXE27416.1 LysM peptidoglycan-binding domain-containing protein [Chlamydia buteonis]QXE27691.1 LysM peptidoglycan-binding domain-containing protein [Chlamydia buteonis]
MTRRKTIRWLKQALVLSAVLNIVFLLLFYSTIFRKDIYKLRLFSGPLVAKNCRVQKIPEDFLERLSEASLEELYRLLDEDHLLYGRPLKLWALSVAIHTYDVDVEGALSHPLTFTQLRSKGKTWLLPNIDEKEYGLVRRYLSLERYPFTTRGLFIAISKNLEQGIVDEDCLYHFCHTPEFLYLRTLLCGAEERVSSVASLARMVIRNGEEIFFSLCNENNRATAISPQQRQKVLFTYTSLGEPLAALLLLVYDEDWVLHKFTDEDLKTFVHLLPKESPYTQDFINRIVETPRSFIVEAKKAEECLTEEKTVYEDYVIKEGDSLWLIARRFGVTIEEIMRVNHLSHHRLLPGKHLKLPPKSS